MKKVLFLLVILSSTSRLYSQSLTGAWHLIRKDAAGKEVKNVVIFSDKHQVSTWYELETGAFISCNGGGWSAEGNTITELVEFDTVTPDRVGESVSFEFTLTDNKLSAGDRVWERLDDGGPGALSGAWLITSRMRNDEMQSIDTSRPRKTMKILSGTRFQWIAFNTETKQFSGTGGGSYTTKNGNYTENIEFFSRDNSRVGASLEFNYELNLGNWQHSGKTSKGAPLYEVWSPRP